MPEDVLGTHTAHFQTDGRLLQELGERLVASPEVALVEIIKNSYDADSLRCEVQIGESGRCLIIRDDGHGISHGDFLGRWMRIASAAKVEDRLSRTYQRPLTGAKGIGRFAVRSLGDRLDLITVADDRELGGRTKLTAAFDWPSIDRLTDIGMASIQFTVERVPNDTATGTALEVRALKVPVTFAGASSLRSDVLRIVSPIAALDGGRFLPANRGGPSDPGFAVSLPGSEEGGTDDFDLAQLVLRNYWARLRIDLSAGRLRFDVIFSTTRTKSIETEVTTAISDGFVADILYFPRRKGVFSGKGIDGRRAWHWVREHCGVAVVDHGFRVKPYGYKYNDWLHLDFDKSHSSRDWRSSIAQKRFPIRPEVRGRPASNPALYLPYNFQLVGAVFVRSAQHSESGSELDLTPSTDREGFLSNKAFADLEDFVRAGVEFLAREDKAELDRLERKETREATAQARQDVRSAIKFIQESPTLSAGDKVRIGKAYKQLADRVDEVEDLNARTRQSLTTMGLLGVVAGFMTHESESLVFGMEEAIVTLGSLAKKTPALRDTTKKLSARLESFKGQLQYARMFLTGVQRGDRSRLSAGAQIRLVVERFGTFASERGIKLTWQAGADVKPPPLSPALYTGVLLNLYTNALKAVLAVPESVKDPEVAARAWNEGRSHVLEVSDNGVGIPPALRGRIWEPLYTTTAEAGNPLGSGMGLGLTLVKQAVEDVGGKISLSDDPPPGFATCFRVTFRQE